MEKESARGTMGRGKGKKSRSPRAFYFSINYCYFYWDTQREPLLRRKSLDWMLRGRDWELVKKCNILTNFQTNFPTNRVLRRFQDKNR